MKFFKFSKRSWINFLGVFLFALVYVSIPYAKLRGGLEFVDLKNYVDLFTLSGVKVFQVNEGTLKEYISNEVLWGMWINGLVDTFSLKVIDALKFTSFITIFLMASYVRRGAGWLWLLLLLNPLLVDAVMSQIRIAFAVSAFYGVFLTRNKWLCWGASALTCSIHTAMLPIVASFWACWGSFRLKLVSERKWLGVSIVVGAGVFLALLLGPLSGYLSSIAAGDRRVAAGHFIAPISLKFSLPWILVLFAFLTQGKDFLRKPNNIFAIYLLSVFSTAVILDVYSTRFLAIAIPALICGVKMIRSSYKRYVLSGLIVLTLIQWYYWMFIAV